MGSAQTEHLGAYCLEGSKAVQVGMWGEAPVLSPERRESRRWCHGNRQTSLPTFPTSQGREEAQQKGLRPATLLSQNPPNPNPLPPGPHPITSILQKARPEEPCWSHPWTPDPSPPPTTQAGVSARLLGGTAGHEALATQGGILKTHPSNTEVGARFCGVPVPPSRYLTGFAAGLRKEPPHEPFPGGTRVPNN